MFGVVEGFALAGAVAAMISGFKDARTLFRAWRAKKHARREHAQKQQLQVQQSLASKPEDIRRRYDIGCVQHGAWFAKGDGTFIVLSRSAEC